MKADRCSQDRQKISPHLLLRQRRQSRFHSAIGSPRMKPPSFGAATPMGKWIALHCAARAHTSTTHPPPDGKWIALHCAAHTHMRLHTPDKSRCFSKINVA